MSDDETVYSYETDDDMQSTGTHDGDEGADLEDDFGLDHHVAACKVQYRILKRAELQKQRKAALDNLTSMLCVSDEDAMRILRKYKWDVNRAQDMWFADEGAVRTALGINNDVLTSLKPQEQLQRADREEKCEVCWDQVPVQDMRWAPCQHFLCRPCWKNYVSTAIANGPTSLDLRCPNLNCVVSVPRALIKEVLDDSYWDRYQHYELRSYVEDNRQMCWCVGKGCDAAVEVLAERGLDEPMDVTCTQCQSAFCFACKAEAHRPVSCLVVHNWTVKNTAESENVQWILANTKPCPNCHRPIEKNQGCMHMTCSQCKYQFCWLCQGDWKEHGDKTGGYFACNRYKKSSNEEEVRKRETAKQSLERYLHYFERWDAHQKARNKARCDMLTSITNFIEDLSEQTKTPSSQLKFILSAWEQIIDCRRVLSWTYTFGYYTYDPHIASSQAKIQQKEFFEFLQGEAESALERLHGLAENQLRVLTSQSGSKYLDAEFLTFRTNLVGLTEVTRNYFVKLVGQLERGFDNLQTDFAGQPSSSASSVPHSAGCS